MMIPEEQSAKDEPEEHPATDETADESEGDGNEICVKSLPNNQFHVYRTPLKEGAEPEMVNGEEAMLKAVLHEVRTMPQEGDEETAMQSGYAKERGPL